MKKQLALFSVAFIFSFSTIIPTTFAMFRPADIGSPTGMQEAVRRGDKSYTTPYGIRKRVTKEDIRIVADNNVWRRKSLKHTAGATIKTTAAERLQERQAIEARRVKIQKARIKQAKQKQKDSKGNKTKVQKINKQQESIQKKLAREQKKTDSIKKLSAEANQTAKIRDAYNTALIEASSGNKKEADLIQIKDRLINDLCKDASTCDRISNETNYGYDLKMNGKNKKVFIKRLGEIRKQYEKKNKKAQKKLNQTKLAPPSQKSSWEKTLAENKKTLDKLSQQSSGAGGSLTDEEKKLLEDYTRDKKKYDDRSQDGPVGGPAGSDGGPSVEAAGAPRGRVAPKSFNNGHTYDTKTDGDIVVLTYLDDPSKPKRLDQRIGNVKVKIDKVKGSPSCDNRPKTSDLTAATNAKKFQQSKDSDDKLFVHGTVNFKGCNSGKYKITIVGREGYKLRNGEDKVQEVTVEKDKTTEVVFTLVKKT